MAYILVALMYVGGALSYWNKLKYHEAFLTANKRLETKDPNQYVLLHPWQKTLMSALWFVVVPIEELGYLALTAEKEL